MSRKRLIPQGLLQPILVLMLVVLFSVSCIVLESGATTTPMPTATVTPSPTPVATSTETPVPGGIVTGRVYLMDRDRPVLTSVRLVRESDRSLVDITETDDEGYYSFLIEEPDTYVIEVSVMDLFGFNCDPSTRSGWPVVVRLYDTSGVSDVLAGSTPLTIGIGDEITRDCELYCN